jgi:hypothetical protein
MDVMNPIQILSAERNWRALFVDPLTKEVVERVVVAWALCQPSAQRPLENTIQGVVHLDGKMVLVGDCVNFVVYLEPGTVRDQYLLRPRS